MTGFVLDSKSCGFGAAIDTLRLEHDLFFSDINLDRISLSRKTIGIICQSDIHGSFPRPACLRKTTHLIDKKSKSF